MVMIPGATLLRAQSGTPPVNLVSPEDQSIRTEGKVTLRWEFTPNTEAEAGEAEFELQQSRDRNFQDPVTRYRGRDFASVLTGYPAGDYYFRVRSVSDDTVGPWSQTVMVTFEYDDMRTVWLLMASGTIVFVLTVGAIGYGHVRSRAETRPDAS